MSFIINCLILSLLIASSYQHATHNFIRDETSTTPEYYRTGTYSTSPEYSTTRTYYSSTTPHYSTTGTDYTSPEYSTTGTDYTSPEYSTTGTGYTSTTPHYSTTGTDYTSTAETSPSYDPNEIPDLQHVNEYISITTNKLDELLNDAELVSLIDELLHLQETDTSDVDEIIRVGLRQRDILEVISNEAKGNVKFCFDVVESMITTSHYNQTHQECLENLDVNVTDVTERYQKKYHDVVSDLSSLQVSYRACNEDDVCKSEYILKLYDLMYTSKLKLENELKTSKAYLNEAIVKIRTCTVEVTDYYTTIFDVVRQCIKNIATMN